MSLQCSRRLLSALALVLLITFGPGASASGATSDVALVNHERTSRGLVALHEDAGLDACALRHSEAMAAKKAVWHDLNQTAYSCAGQWQVYGENVGSGPSVQAIHDAYMKSAEHRANILRPGFRLLGDATVWRNGVAYNTEIFETRAVQRSANVTAVAGRRIRRKPNGITRVRPRHQTYAGSVASRNKRVAPLDQTIVVDMLVRMQQWMD